MRCTSDSWPCCQSPLPVCRPRSEHRSWGVKEMSPGMLHLITHSLLSREPYMFGVLSAPIWSQNPRRVGWVLENFSHLAPFLLMHKWWIATSSDCWLLSCGEPGWTGPRGHPGWHFIIAWHWGSTSSVWPAGWCPFATVVSRRHRA